MNGRMRAWSLLVDVLFGRREGGSIELRDSDHASPFWTDVLSFANANLVTATFWKALARCGLEARVPATVATYLSSFYALNTARNESLLAQVYEAIGALNRRGIRPMPIKGAAYLMSGLYEDAGERFFADIDLLVPVAAAAEACGALREIGYAENDQETFDHAGHHHLTPLVRADAPAAIELHLAAVPPYAEPALPTADLWARAAQTDRDDASYLLPAPLDEVMLSFLHTEIVDRNFALFFLPLRPLYDMRRLIERCGDAVDWRDALSRAAAIGAAARLRSVLFVLQELCGEQSFAELAFCASDRVRLSICKRAVAWPVISRWSLRLERLTERKIRERYRIHGAGSATVNLCRMREIGAMVAGAGKAAEPQRM